MVEGFAGFESRTPVAATPERHRIRQTVIGRDHDRTLGANRFLLISV
jgi:hypothetical protein